MSFWQDYKWVILFYSAIILIVYLFRKKFIVQSKIVYMYKTKVGLRLMDRWGEKYREQIRLLGIIGIGVGFIGMASIVYMLTKNFVSLLTVPKAASAVSLVIPGVKMPGSSFVIPLITGWIGLFIVILVHESSHGFVARANKVPIKSSGIFFLGPLMGAFVEPDDKVLNKKDDIVQHSIFAAGPWSNIILAVICMALVIYALAPLSNSMVDPLGITLAGVSPDLPAEAAGLGAGMLITDIDGQPIRSYNDFTTYLLKVGPDETLDIVADGQHYNLTTVAHPNDASQGYLGVLANTVPKLQVKNDALWYNILYKVLHWFIELINITGILSFGIGLANLLPLGPVDGGRMLLISLQKIRGKVNGLLWWKRISLFALFLLIVNIFWPGFKFIFKTFGILLGLG